MPHPEYDCDDCGQLHGAWSAHQRERHVAAVRGPFGVVEDGSGLVAVRDTDLRQVLLAISGIVIDRLSESEMNAFVHLAQAARMAPQWRVVFNDIGIDDDADFDFLVS